MFLWWMYRTFPRLPGNSMERFAAKSSVVSARAYIYSLLDKSSAMIQSCLSAAARSKSVISDKSLSKVKKDSTGRTPKTVKYVLRPILCELSNFGEKFSFDSSDNVSSLVLWSSMLSRLHWGGDRKFWIREFRVLVTANGFASPWDNLEKIENTTTQMIDIL